ncbi:hypothetical protein [Kribbella monticola]|uniref:hypothetical protein n=1 Tax=Kribbella monticola TaxID=2185285 RepID=UPI000DD39C1F|nr:hypothetical protein [Kribbella monticola]
MNDTESRLRDYLTAKAGTIADDQEAPDLQPAHRHRSWPIIVAAAATAAVLIGGIPVALHVVGKDKTPPPVGGPSNELRIPYVTSADHSYLGSNAPKTGDAILHDGEQTVPSISDHATYYGRVGGGWLTDKPHDGRPTQAGLLMPDGSFRPLGPVNSKLAVPSPDRRQIVTSLRLANHRTKVIVVDVATGKETASITVPRQMVRIYGWNKNGIWFGADYDVKAQPMIWQPGSDPLQLSIPNFTVTATAPPQTDRVLVSTTVGGKRCLEVGVLAGTRFAVIRRYCPKAGASAYPVLSPDGRTIVSSEQKVAVDVATGKVTALRLEHSLQGFPEPVFEDATHLITLPAPLAAGPNGRGIIPPGTPTDEHGAPLIGAPVYRCDTTTGTCTHIFTTTPRTLIELALP